MSEERIEKTEKIDGAENLGVVRKIVETVDIKSDRLKNIEERLENIEDKMEKMEQKMDEYILNGTNEEKLKKIHRRILEMLDNWLSTKDLANILSYRQEYISRKVSDLKKMGLLEEKREGKSIRYRRKEGVNEVID